MEKGTVGGLVGDILGPGGGGHQRLRAPEEEDTQKGCHRKFKMSRGESAAGK